MSRILTRGGYVVMLAFVLDHPRVELVFKHSSFSPSHACKASGGVRTKRSHLHHRGRAGPWFTTSLVSCSSVPPVHTTVRPSCGAFLLLSVFPRLFNAPLPSPLRPSNEQPKNRTRNGNKSDVLRHAVEHTALTVLSLFIGQPVSSTVRC